MLSASSWNANVCCLLYKHHRPHHPNHHPYRQGSTSCAILSSQMGEHGEPGEHGKTGKHQPDVVKKSLFVTQNALFVNQMTQHTLLYGFYVDGWKIITYALGGHDPGSA